MNKTCTDCIHYDVCREWSAEFIDERLKMGAGCVCKDFKDKSRYIELPCAVGDVVYYISLGKVYKGKCHAITLKPTLQIHLYDFDGDNASYSAKDVFLTKEEAEKVLKGGAE